MNQPFLPTLYARGSGGAVLQWSIFVDGGSFWSEAGQVGGSLVASAPTKTVGKNLGKANETMPAQQAIIEAQAKWDKKKKQNYFENVADIDNGFLEPQLAKPCKDYLDKVKWQDGIVLDDKLNGFACILTAKGAFTRTNEEYHAIPHIIAEFQQFFIDNPDAYVQGELFNHDFVNNLGALAELIAVTRKPKDIDQALLEESRRIVQFHWYDGYGFNHGPRSIVQETELLHRRETIDVVIKQLGSPYVKPVHYDIVRSEKEAFAKRDEYVARGGEGKIAKNPKAPYQHKRTKDLLKLKKSEDKEFRIVDDMDNPFVEGVGNSQGAAEAVWCYVKGTRTDRFKANIEGPKDKLRVMFQNPAKYKGQWITVRFQEYSPYGIPLIPYTDMVLREEVEGKGSVNAGEKVVKTSVAPVDFLSDEPKQDAFDL